MKCDPDRIDDLLLALLYSYSSEVAGEMRSWKGYPSDALRRLFENGYIEDPGTKRTSLTLTKAGVERARSLAGELIGRAP